MSLKKLCAALLVLALLMVSPAMASSISVVTNASTEAYSMATGNANSVTVPKGLSLKLKDYSGDWGRVTYKGHTAFIPLKYLDLAKPVKAYLSKSATLYTSAGSGGTYTVPKGTTVYVMGVDGDYARVTNHSRSITGYISKGAITTSKATALLATSDDSRIEAAILTAQKLIGRPYALAANPPSNFNCAAFVEYCYNKAQSGSVKETLGGQVNDSRYEKIDSISSLKRGDMVCFNVERDSDRIGHVGIYLGSGYFIHASASDKKVTVSTLKSGYYKRCFSWGRRIFN